MPGTFHRHLTLIVTLLAAGHVFAQVSPTETQTLARKPVQPNSLAGQSVVATAATQAVTKAVSEAPIEPEAASGTNRTIHQIKAQATLSKAKAASTGGNDLSEQISNLEPTGQYIERDLRIPEGNNGGARFVRFLVPVYKEKQVTKAVNRGNQYR